jgi:hypothetical protein
MAEAWDLARRPEQGGMDFLPHNFFTAHGHAAT